MATNQSTCLTVGTFRIPKKLLDLVGNIGHLREMILIEPINIFFGEMIGICQNSLTFELRGLLGIDKVTIDVVALIFSCK
jgi:hypothetical protein